MPDLTLSEEGRAYLKQPFGRLVKDQDVQNYLISIPKNAILITVGDRTTERCEDAGLSPFVEIVDGKERRERVSKKLQYMKEVKVSNPAGMITEESVNAIAEALNGKVRVRIIVDGEEDLLVIPCIIHAKPGSIVMYGQPGEGLVSLKVDKKAKERVKRLIATMMKKV